MGGRVLWKSTRLSVHAYVTSLRGESLMKLTLVTIVTTNLEPMCVLSAGA